MERFRTRARRLDGRLVAGVVCALAAAIAVPTLVASGSATTSPTNFKIFKVRLTDRGVVFKPKAQLEVGEVGLFRVTNASRTRRVFAVSTRSTHPLKTRGNESLYEIFPQTGKVTWTSHAAKGRSFKGFLRVVPCQNVNGTSLCNGTGD